jgi:hypothetical protein
VASNLGVGYDGEIRSAIYVDKYRALWVRVAAFLYVGKKMRGIYGFDAWYI